jgi:exosortase K
MGISKEKLQKQENILFYGLAVSVFMLLKFIYTALDNDSLRFLLYPTNKCIELATNSTAIYAAETGYFHPDLNILIEKSCSGFNFLLLCFLLLFFSNLARFKTAFAKILFLPIALIISYLFTIFVNTSRIMSAIVIERTLPHSSKQFPWLHEAEGVFIYLSFLIAFYYVSNLSGFPKPDRL